VLISVWWTRMHRHVSISSLLTLCENTAKTTQNIAKQETRNIQKFNDLRHCSPDEVNCISVRWDVPYFPDYKWRFFLATAASQLILRCHLCADKFIGMPLSLLTRWETIGLLTVSQWVALTAQSYACVMWAQRRANHRA